MKCKLVAILAVSTGLLSTPSIGYADDHSDGTSNATRVRIGYEIAPVALNLRGKNRDLVGLGSYIVNAQGGCNDCHTYPSFMPDGDPFMGEPEVINSEQYLTGGRLFGPFMSSEPDAGSVGSSGRSCVLGIQERDPYRTRSGRPAGSAPPTSAGDAVAGLREDV